MVSLTPSFLHDNVAVASNTGLPAVSLCCMWQHRSFDVGAV